MLPTVDSVKPNSPKSCTCSLFATNGLLRFLLVKKSATDAVKTFSLGDKISRALSTATEDKKTYETFNSKTEDDDRMVKARLCGDGTFSVFPRKNTTRDFFCVVLSLKLRTFICHNLIAMAKVVYNLGSKIWLMLDTLHVTSTQK